MGIAKDVMARGRRTWRLESEWIILGLAISSCVMIALSLALFYNELSKEEKELERTKERTRQKIVTPGSVVKTPKRTPARFGL